jgi:hypothetical protein
MSVKLRGQYYVTFSFIKPCLKSLQVEMGALCLDYEESDFKTVRNFYIEQFWSFKDSFLMASTFLESKLNK